MALSLTAPFIHVEDANGLPYVGATLAVYLPGTTTPADIFSDEALSVAMSNPLDGDDASDAAGNFPRFYVADGTYKLRAEDADGQLIWEWDDIDTGLQASTGALPIARGGTGATTAAQARSNLDVPSNSELADLADDISDIQSSLQNIVSFPQGYLTLTSGTPVITGSVAAATAVYYTPDIGNLYPSYDGSQFNVRAFAELTLTLVSNHVASGIYDCFLINDSGTDRLVTGPVWNTVTAGSGARGSGAGTTELSRVSGILTNKYSMTARNGATTYAVDANKGTYVGSIYIDAAAGQITCHRAYGQSRKWGVWNAYNQRRIVLQAGDGTASWTYNSATVRAARADSTNSLTVFQGIANEQITVRDYRDAQSNDTGSTTFGIGFNSTTAYSGKRATVSQNITTGALRVGAVAEYCAAPFNGVNVFSALEAGNANGSTFYGTETNFVLEAEWRG